MEFIVFMLAAPWLAAIAATAAVWVGDEIAGRRLPQGADFSHRLAGGFDLLTWVATVLMQAAIASLFVTIPVIWLEWFGFAVPGWMAIIDISLMAGGIITYACVSGLVVLVVVHKGLEALDDWRRRVVPAVGGDNEVPENRDESNPFVAPRSR